MGGKPMHGNDPVRGDGAWGTEIVVRDGPIPFRCYRPRRGHVADLLGDAARWHDRVHLVQGARRLTFGGVLAAVVRVEAALRTDGLRPGDRLLLLTPNSPEWVVAMWAGLRLGAVVALGNGWWGRDEVGHAVELVEPRLVVADDRRRNLLPMGTGIIDVGAVRAWVDAAVDSGDTCDPAPPTPPSHEDDPAILIFTAGTTGAPKAVTLAHRSLIANLHNLLVVSRRLPQQVDAGRPPAVSLQSGPLFHIGGLQSLLLALVGGNTQVFLAGRFDPGQVLDLIERERVTWWGAIPTMASRVLDHPTLPGRDLTSVRSISMGGAPVQPALVERLRAAFPNAARGMSTIYGMTETGGTVASASGVLMARHPTTSGPPLPVVEMRIEDPAPTGEGEIVLRTPGQMLGYWAAGGVSADDDMLDTEGWIHTGDLGRLEDGLLHVTGRKKDLIIRGGENIAPAHVEAVLLTHPAVAAVAVLGLPDPDLGERVGAVVQLAEGAETGAGLEAQLSAHVGERLARFQVPAQWWLWHDPLPTNESGKVVKPELRRAWLAVLAPPTC